MLLYQTTYSFVEQSILDELVRIALYVKMTALIMLYKFHQYLEPREVFFFNTSKEAGQVMTHSSRE
jgi:hypothetical protein